MRISSTFYDEKQKKKVVYIINEHGDIVDQTEDIIHEKYTKIREDWIEKEMKKRNYGYKDQAELSYDVMYPKIRAPLMGIVFQEMSGKKKVSVVALDDKGATVYSGDTKKKIKDPVKYLEKERRSD